MQESVQACTAARRSSYLVISCRRSRRWRWSRFGWILQNSTSASTQASQALKRWGVIWYCPGCAVNNVSWPTKILKKMILYRTHKGCRCTGCPAMHIGPSNDILPDSNFGNNNTRVYFHPFACHFALVWVRPSDHWYFDSSIKLLLALIEKWIHYIGAWQH